MYQSELFPEEPPTEQLLSVSELTEQIKAELEGTFQKVAVSGEICNFSRPQSGHCYFTLKDESAQIRAVIWRSTAARLRFDLHDGLEVVCRGSLDVYLARGTYQLVINEIQPKGMGALELALRQLQAKLAGEGLFAAERKRALPRFPRQIAVITSPSGAAIRDFLEVLRRRWRGVHVWILPVRVQGTGAGQEIVKAFETVNRHHARIDCAVVARGGGSLEDLWTFNEERVVRALASCRVPVISAIGHEIDVTLCDLVADVRALTPSEAAERVVPTEEEVRAVLLQRQRRLAVALRRRALLARTHLNHLESHRIFRRPFDRVHELARQLDELSMRTSRAGRQHLGFARNQIERCSGHLETLSPLGVLARGYSITERTEDGSLVRDAESLKIGASFRTRLARGNILGRVEGIELDGPGASDSRNQV